MARLNEGPDNVEALKRRFIRQNREIAKINSQQSQRIRNLETEISRLLSENISIREAAISAQNDAAQNREVKQLAKDLGSLKTRMVQKIAEVTGLVEELDALSERTKRRSSVRRRKSGYVQELAGSPNREKDDWTTKRPPREFPEPSLPAIIEGKSYPRRTLEKDAAVFQSARVSDSTWDTKWHPDLPQPRFDLADVADYNASPGGQERPDWKATALPAEHGDAVADSAQRKEERSRRRSVGPYSSIEQKLDTAEEPIAAEKSEKNPDGVATLSLFNEIPGERQQPSQPSLASASSTQDGSDAATVNIETRRKRRTSAFIQPAAELESVQRSADPKADQTPDLTNGQQVAPRAAMSSTVARAGAKRRLSMSELQDPNGTRGVSKELDDFIYQRKQAAVTSATKPSRFTARQSAVRPDQNNSNVPNPAQLQQNSSTSTRKILAPKSLNSPSKRRTAITSKLEPQKNQALAAAVKESRPVSRTQSRVDVQKSKSQIENEPASLELGKLVLPSINTSTIGRDTSASYTPTDEVQTASSNPVSRRRSIRDPSAIASAATDLDNFPPKTPATELAADLFSPPDSAADSTNVRKVQEVAQTNNPVEDVLNGSIGRGSRRARAAVSYAEPNLRDKMRREGGRVSAVDGGDSRRRSTAA